MNVFIRELKAHRKSIIIWSAAMILFVFAGMQKYTSFVGAEDSTDIFMNMIDSMPKFLKSLWGISSLDITSAVGYFGVVISYLLLMAGIHASMLGVGLIYKEERDKTVEFLMAKPLSRNKIVTAKIFAGIVNLIIFNIVTFTTSFIILKGLTSEPFIDKIILSMFAMFFIQLLFMIIGIGVASIMKHPKKSGIITMAILIITFFLSIIVDLISKLEVFKFLTPFKYFEAKDFFISGSLNIVYIFLTILIIGLILLFTYKQYTKRDLNL